MQAVLMNRQEFKVEVRWDHEAEVWYVADSDVPGLVAEAEKIPEMVCKLRVLVPELLELNSDLVGPDSPDVPVNLVVRHEETIRQAS